MLQNYVDGTDLANQFELTLEVTHHGPWLEVPALFIEIGSTKETWPHEGAAELLARIISDGMGISSPNGAGLWNSDNNAGGISFDNIGWWALCHPEPINWLLWMVFGLVTC